MDSMETRWLYMTSEELEGFRDQVNGVCVIPVGCVEKHGLHLPLGTDTFIAEGIAYLASQIEPVCVFPVFPFGDKSLGNPSAPAGTISLPMETEMMILEQLLDQIGRYGFQKILICNGHGGNNAMLTALLQKLDNKKKNYVVGVIGPHPRTLRQMAEYLLKNGAGSIPELLPEDESVILRYYHENIPTGHGCMAETAWVMGIVPETVKLHRLGIESGKCLHLTDYFREAGIEIRDDGWYEDYPTSYASEVDPVECNERIGKAIVRFEAERIAKAYKVMKEDTNLLKWQEQRQQGW